jgi:hypothetical protein
MATSNERSVVLLLLLSSKISESFLLTEAMRNAGLVTSLSEVGETAFYQFGSTFAASALANKIVSSGQMASNTGVTPLFFHVPTVFDYINASKSKEDCLVRTSLVIIFYSACGIANFVSIETATAVSPALAAFAQFMVANSFLIILPSNYSFGKKIILSSLISGFGFRLVRQFPLKYCLKFTKSLFNRLSKSKVKPRPKIKMENYIKVVFLAFGIENLIIT